MRPASAAVDDRRDLTTNTAAIEPRGAPRSRESDAKSSENLARTPRDYLPPLGEAGSERWKM
jgi:hypothetical protein